MPTSMPRLAEVPGISEPQMHLRGSASGTLQLPEPFTTFPSSGFIFSLHFIKARDLYNPEACLPVFSPVSPGNLDQI